jgi:enoyl-CoA hydratase
MADIAIRQEGRAGRITLTRPQALNALSYEMCLAADRALKDWARDPSVHLVMIDAEGSRAFCAGGDLGEMYETGTAGNYSYGQTFWADEYRMNARVALYPKPVVSFLHGFTMGGGVGLGCHASHRIVGESAQIAMPECTIGLIPDVGGTLILSRAPGRLGAYLGTTGARMGPGDAILAGFANHFVPEADWAALKAELVDCGSAQVIRKTERTVPVAALAGHQTEIDTWFDGKTLAEVMDRVGAASGEFARATEKALARVSPLAAACTLEVLRRYASGTDILSALSQEYRFTWRALERSDFLEGIRATIIDKDRSPRWRHADVSALTSEDVAAMLAPLGQQELSFVEERT